MDKFEIRNGKFGAYFVNVNDGGMMSELGLEDVLEILNGEMDKKQEAPVKTGLVMREQDIPNGFVGKYWYITDMGEVHDTDEDWEEYFEMRVVAGNAFHDKASAEREATKRKVLHKLKCEFGDDVILGKLYNYGFAHTHNYNSVDYSYNNRKFSNAAVNKFIDSLNPTELEAIRGE